LPPEFTEDDLEVAEAEVEFAMQNCPVEGILSTSDGGSVTFDDLQAILGRLKGLEGQPSAIQGLEGEQILQLEALSEYTYENCPVESTATYQDGRQVSARDIATLTDKLRALSIEPVPII
jgi:hypothetical protein